MQQLTKIKTKHSTVWLDDEGFLILKMQDGVEIDMAEAIACLGAYNELGFGKGKKALQLILAKEVVNMQPDVRKFVSEQGRYYFIASAVVGQSLAVRLLVNFFNTFYKHDVPFKMFENEEAARKWLRTF